MKVCRNITAGTIIILYYLKILKNGTGRNLTLFR